MFLNWQKRHEIQNENKHEHMKSAIPFFSDKKDDGKLRSGAHATELNCARRPTERHMYGPTPHDAINESNSKEAPPTKCRPSYSWMETDNFKGTAPTPYHSRELICRIRYENGDLKADAHYQRREQINRKKLESQNG